MLNLRDAHLDTFRLIAVVGAILAQAAISALSLPLLAETHYCARGLFVSSLANSLFAIYFTYIQHRTLSFIQQPTELRVWLYNGITYRNTKGMDVWQSLIVAHSLLRVPYETISLSLTFFVVGLGVYLGSACA